MDVYKVGGAVRDQLMGREPKDVDWVVVGSSTEEMIRLGFKQVGASFPVFLHPETGDEWALARTEQKAGVGHTGFSVETENVTIESDLKRRDFTTNSIAFNPVNGEYIDPYGGVKDIKAKILRHTSLAFSEDPLRVVRLARFYARYSEFSVADETMELSKQIVKSGEMDTISKERFVKEFEKVILDDGSDFGRFVDLLYKLGVFQNVRFFKDVFGDISSSHLLEMKKHFEAARKCNLETSEILVATFSSVMAPNAAKVFGNDVNGALNALQIFTSADYSAEGVVYALVKTRSTNAISTHANCALNVLAALWPIQQNNLLFSAHDWRKFASITSNLDIINLVANFAGKELGRQISLAMITAIRQEMNNES
jgi:tRNA nucleotidyltransferase/poly(A) polymerase